MSEPLDHQIVTGLSRLLRGISRQNGYRTDCGRIVLDEESDEDLTQEDAYIEVLDEDESVDGQAAGARKSVLSLVIAIHQATDTVDLAARREARRIFADIRQAIAPVAKLASTSDWIRGVIRVEFTGRSLFVREAGSRFYNPELRLRVTFAEPHHPTSP